MRDKIPLVSVVMSVYDGGEPEHLSESVNSILNQTFDDFEFIIVLDGVSRNDIKTFLETSKESDRRIRLIYISENKGLANALNNAIKSAVGEFIVRMDADDISHPDRVAKLVWHMLSNEDVDVAGSFIAEFSDESGIKRILEYPIRHEDIKDLFAKRNSIAHASVIFRRRFFDKAGFYPLFSINNEDTLLFLSAFINGCKFSNIDEVLYSVRFTKKTAGRRVSLRKAISDFVDRLRVIIDLRASRINVLYALGLLVIQIMPCSIYDYIRSKIVAKPIKS